MCEPCSPGIALIEGKGPHEAVVVSAHGNLVADIGRPEQRGGDKGGGDCNALCHRHETCNPALGLGQSTLIRVAAVFPLISCTGAPVPKTSVGSKSF